MIRPLAALLALSLPVAVAAEEFPFDRVHAVIDGTGFEGDIVISSGLDDLEIGGPRYGWTGLLPEPDRGWPDGLTWRWASVTKQVVAILVMKQVEAGTIDLDQPVATYLPAFRSANAGTATIRNLLQHRAGLPNPADAPEFYSADFKGSRDPLTGFCAGPVTGAPGGDWAYNNCDYMVLGAVLEAVTGLSWDKLFLRDIAAVTGQVLTLGFFLTPILYDRAGLPAQAAFWLGLNPMAAPVEAVRRALTGQSPDWLALGGSLAVALALLWLANALFRRARSHLEDFL